MAEKGENKILIIITICIILISIGLSGCVEDDENNKINRCVNFHIENISIKDIEFDMKAVIINISFMESNSAYTYYDWYKAGITIKKAHLKSNKDYQIEISLINNNSTLKIFGNERKIDGFIKYSDNDIFLIKINNGNSSDIEGDSKEIIMKPEDNKLIAFYGLDANISIRLIPFLIT